MDVLPEHENLRAAYKKAEDAIHDLGIEVDGADTAAVNELRYAGNHILRSLTTTDDKESADELNRAMRHCERAVYDAYDSAIYYHLSRFNKFREQYANMVISDVVPNYLELSKSMTQAKRLLAKAREDNSNRSDYYAQVRELYPQIVDISDILGAARDELNKKNREKRTGWLLPVIAAVVGGFVGAVGKAILD